MGEGEKVIMGSSSNNIPAMHIESSRLPARIAAGYGNHQVSVFLAPSHRVLTPDLLIICADQ